MRELGMLPQHVSSTTCASKTEIFALTWPRISPMYTNPILLVKIQAVAVFKTDVFSRLYISSKGDADRDVNVCIHLSFCFWCHSTPRTININIWNKNVFYPFINFATIVQALHLASEETSNVQTWGKLLFRIKVTWDRGHIFFHQVKESVNFRWIWWFDSFLFFFLLIKLFIIEGILVRIELRFIILLFPVFPFLLGVLLEQARASFFCAVGCSILYFPGTWFSLIESATKVGCTAWASFEQNNGWMNIL